MTELATTSLLDVRDLRTEFVTREGVVRAVRGVSLTVEPGQKVAIVGESGSGKSTLALSVMGLIEAPGRVTGGVWLNGRRISGLSDRELGRIRGKEMSLIFQDPMDALDPVKTIGDQILEAVARHQPQLGKKGARRRALELLREAEVPYADRRLDDYPHQYSGGMRQRVMIAIALANEPSLLIADEPTTALDVTTQAQILSLLERLVEELDTAIMLITHNLAVVALFCDSAHVMYAGRIVESARLDELFRLPTHPYTEALLGCVPRRGQSRRGRLPVIPGLPPNLGKALEGCSFEPRCSVGRGREICCNSDPKLVPVGEAGAEVACHFGPARRAAADTEQRP
jgi:oligopeptide/dipeptide ABC transporter ATP-binding protein